MLNWYNLVLFIANICYNNYMQTCQDSEDIAKITAIGPATRGELCPFSVTGLSNEVYFRKLADAATLLEDPTTSVDIGNRAAHFLFNATNVRADRLRPDISLIDLAYQSVAYKNTAGLMNGRFWNEERVSRYRTASYQIPGFYDYSVESGTPSPLFGNIYYDVYDEFFSLGSLLYTNGKDSIQTLHSQYGLTTIHKYPFDILTDQLDQDAVTKREVTIFSKNGIQHAAGQDKIYMNIAAAAKRYSPSYRVVIREFKSAESFREQSLAAHKPIIGFVNGHGNWDSVGGIRAHDIEDKSYSTRAKRVWNQAAGIALLGCANNYECIPRSEPSIAQAFAQTFGVPVVAYDDVVTDVRVKRLIHPKETWKVMFASEVKGYKGASIITPFRVSRNRVNTATIDTETFFRCTA